MGGHMMPRVLLDEALHYGLEGRDERVQLGLGFELNFESSAVFQP